VKAWQKHRLGDVVDEGGGSIQTGPFGSQLHASDYVAEGIPCIMPANMKNNRVDVSGIARISEHDANRLKRHIVKTGDIVYSRRGDVTQKALIRENENGFFCGTGCLLLRPGKKIDPAFLTYYFSTKTYQSWIASQAVGATMPNLNTGILNRVSFCAPDKDDQERIASVLTALDAKIELNNRINAELEGLAKLLYDYWFVQFDFPMSAAQAAALGKPHLTGHPYRASGGKMIYNETLKREIPEGWNVCNVGDVLAKEQRTKNVLNSEIADQGRIPVIDQGSAFICGFTDDEDSVIKDTPKIVFGDHTRILKFINFPFARGADGTQIMTSRESLLPQHLFYYQLLSIDLSNYGYARHFKFLKDQKVILPNEDAANAFEQVAASIYAKIKNNIFQNQELTQLRDWLLPMLMNGQVTVGTNER
jgi:type I restriction enzyme S subunit